MTRSGWLKQSEKPLPPEVLEILTKEIGVDPRLVAAGGGGGAAA
jgi:hypothetical protein